MAASLIRGRLAAVLTSSGSRGALKPASRVRTPPSLQGSPHHRPAGCPGPLPAQTPVTPTVLFDISFSGAEVNQERDQPRTWTCATASPSPGPGPGLVLVLVPLLDRVLG